MDPLDQLSEKKLAEVFRRKKTTFVCMEEDPFIFLSQLRDHELITEDLYQKVINLDHNEMKKGVYKILEWIEKGQLVREFWTCMFQNHIMKKYSDLKLLRDELLGGSLKDHPNADETSNNGRNLVQDKEETAKTTGNTGDPTSANKAHQITQSGVEGPKADKPISKEKNSVQEEEITANHMNPDGLPSLYLFNEHPNAEEPSNNENTLVQEKEETAQNTEKTGPLPHSTPIQKSQGDATRSLDSCIEDPNEPSNNEKNSDREEEETENHMSLDNSTSHSSPLGKRAMQADQLSVNCGDKEGILYLAKLARSSGEKSIWSEGRWLTPIEFEKFGGKGSRKKWKTSIRHKNITLKKLMVEENIMVPYLKKHRAQQGLVRTLRSNKCRLPDLHSASSLPFSSEAMEDSCGGVTEQRENIWVSVQEEEKEASEAMEEPCDGVTDQRENIGVGVQEEEKEVEEEYEVKEESGPAAQAVFEPPTSASGGLYKENFTGNLTKSIHTQEDWFSELFLMLKNESWEKDILGHGETIDDLMMLDQNNDGLCFICHHGSNLVGCEMCSRYFHGDCHVPIIEDINTHRDDWKCTFCLFKAYMEQCLPVVQWLHVVQEEALNSPVFGNDLWCEYLLLRLYKEDVQQVFTKDPSATVKNYSNVISMPMWLDQVRVKLKKKRYNTVREFVEDIRLIFHNCNTFNKDNKFGRMGSRLSEIFEQKLQKVFSFLHAYCPA